MGRALLVAHSPGCWLGHGPAWQAEGRDVGDALLGLERPQTELAPTPI
jgi:hypothetical protein